jgi:hypothetical protein
LTYFLEFESGVLNSFDCWSDFFLRTFFTVASLGLALATVRVFPLADFDTLRGSFPCFCTFDCFLRLAMIPPVLVGAATALVSD